MGSVVVVLDANVLFPAVLRNHLLHLAEQGVYRPLWTDAILQEMCRAILAKRPDLPVRSALGAGYGKARSSRPDTAAGPAFARISLRPSTTASSHRQFVKPLE